MARVINRTITIDAFIGKLIRDFGLEKIPDKYYVAEWVSEALSEMATMGASEQAVICFNVVNHTAVLPSDVIQVVQFGTYACNIDDPYVYFPGHLSLLTPFKKATSTLLETVNLTYSEVSNGVYRFSIPCGRVFANVYRRILDAEGLPQIPESFNGLNAVAYYVMSCIEKAKLHKLKNNNYEFYYNEWRRLLEQHQNDILTADLGDKENIHNLNSKFFKRSNFRNFFSEIEHKSYNNIGFNSTSTGNNNLIGNVYHARLGAHIPNALMGVTKLYNNDIKIDCLDTEPTNVCNGYTYYDLGLGVSRFWNPVTGWERIAIGNVSCTY